MAMTKEQHSVYTGLKVSLLDVLSALECTANGNPAGLYLFGKTGSTDEVARKDFANRFDSYEVGLVFEQGEDDEEDQ